MEIKFKNRYGDIFTFTLLSKKEVLWEGNFKYHRVGYSNEFDVAYDMYLKENINNNPFNYKNFVDILYDNVEEHSEIRRKYSKYIKTNMELISMVDPSGGPYISVGSYLDFLKGLKGYMVTAIESHDSGYLLKIKKTSKLPKTT